MKKRKKRKVFPTDYTSPKYTRCWTCQNACAGCNWSRFGEPVPGWEAKKIVIPSNENYAEGWFVVSCPEYVEDLRK